MMKLMNKPGRQLAARLTSLMLLAVSAPLCAHPGHGVDSAVHGLLHVEHILTLVAVMAVLIVVSVSNKR